MVYSLVKCRQTEYAVDWEVVERFCRSYWSSFYQYQYAECVTMSETTWYNPFSWSLPDTKTVDIDWKKVEESTARAVISDMFTYQSRAANDMAAVAFDVQDKVTRTVSLKNQMKDWMREIQDVNVKAMTQAEKNYDGMIEACRFIRDTSADIVAIGSTIATGGAASGLLAGSSALKGVYKYQDTGSAGAAVLYGAGSMLIGKFKIGGATPLTKGQEYGLIVVQGILEGGTTLASGKSFGEAVQSGGLKIASAAGAQKLFDSTMVKKIFERMPIPANVFNTVWRSGSEYMAVDVANKVAEKTGKKLVEKGAKAGLKAVGTFIAGQNNPPPPAGGSGFLDDVPITDQILLNLSIVNMDKGIGRGW